MSTVEAFALAGRERRQRQRLRESFSRRRAGSSVRRRIAAETRKAVALPKRERQNFLELSLSLNTSLQPLVFRATVRFPRPSSKRPRARLICVCFGSRPRNPPKHSKKNDRTRSPPPAPRPRLKQTNKPNNNHGSSPAARAADRAGAGAPSRDVFGGRRPGRRVDRAAQRAPERARRRRFTQQQKRLSGRDQVPAAAARQGRAPVAQHPAPEVRPPRPLHAPGPAHRPAHHLSRARPRGQGRLPALHPRFRRRRKRERRVRHQNLPAGKDVAGGGRDARGGHDGDEGAEGEVRVQAQPVQAHR